MKNFSQIFKALSDSSRLKILANLQKLSSRKSCEKNNCDISHASQGDNSMRACPCIKDIAKKMKLTLPTISHHIKVLSNANLITTKKSGQCCYCQINSKKIQEISTFLNNFIPND